MNEMPLSQAIRLGALLSPQGRGGGMDGETRCALAAASDALGIAGLHDDVNGRMLINYHRLEQRFPILRNLIVTGPVPSLVEPQAKQVIAWIWYLNDTCGWTRGQIADWVEQVECEHSTVLAAEEVTQ